MGEAKRRKDLGLPLKKKILSYQNLINKRLSRKLEILYTNILLFLIYFMVLLFLYFWLAYLVFLNTKDRHQVSFLFK